MAKKTTTIHYAPDETGPAEVLRGPVVRIVSTPVLGGMLFQDDIVLLDRPPDDDINGYHEIKRVFYSRFSARADVRFDTMEAAAILRAMFRLLDAEGYIIWLPTDSHRGLMIIGHQGDIDPVALAEAIGLRQEDDEDESRECPVDRHEEA